MLSSAVVISCFCADLVLLTMPFPNYLMKIEKAWQLTIHSRLYAIN